MNRSPFALPLVALCAAMAIIAGLAVTIVSPAVVDAQEFTSPALSLHVSEPSADQPFRTVALGLDPGRAGLAALSASVVFDTNDVTVSSCSVSEVGACNVTDDGTVLFSMFNLGRIEVNDQLVTINFTQTDSASPTTTISVSPTAVVNNAGARIETATGDSVEVELYSPTVGSLTGSVVDAESTTGLYDLSVCVINDATGAETCTTTTGLGTWRLDDLPTGTYAVVLSDTTRTYESAVLSGFVTEDQVAVVPKASLGDYVEVEEAEEVEAVEETEDASLDEPTGPFLIEPPRRSEAPAATTPIEVIYEASIAGVVTGLETELPVEAVQVCATQPLVLHQSCATTDANGVFALSGLSAGNYWVEIVDPLGQLEQTRPRLVGVVGDDVARTGVNIALASIAE